MDKTGLNCEDCGVELTEKNTGRYAKQKCRECDLKHRKKMARLCSGPGKKVWVDLEL
jgi:hypothetical protein